MQAIGVCINCNRSITQHMLDDHRAILRQAHLYCIQCICTKGAGDFPTVGQYRILHRVGRGGMAEVFLAVQTTMYRLVAFKWLKNMLLPSPDKMKRFARECAIGANLAHPNIVQFFDAGHEGNTYYIIMEFVQGETLEERVQRQPFLVSEVISIAFPLIEALGCAFQHHIVHRDLKPANVFITREGMVKLSDFGIAKYFDEVDLSQVETRSGMTMGTAPYMPPEQFENAKRADHRSDIYALGATLYKLLTNRYPIPMPPGTSIPGYLKCVLLHIPQPPSQFMPGLPNRLDQLILKCLKKNPEQRFQTPAEIREVLRSLIQ